MLDTLLYLKWVASKGILYSPGDSGLCYMTAWMGGGRWTHGCMNALANAGDRRDAGLIPGREDPLEEGLATHCSVLAWRIPGPEEPGGLKSTASQRVRQD